MKREIPSAEEITQNLEEEGKALQSDFLELHKEDLFRTPVSEMEPTLESADPTFYMNLQKRASKHAAEGEYLRQGIGEPETMNTPAKARKPIPTPEEAEEQGILSKMVDFTSDASTGFVMGLGYGADELVASTSSLLNMLTPDEVMNEQYESRMLSKYLDEMAKQKGVYGNGVVDASRSIGQFVLGWIPMLRAVKMLDGASKLGKAGEFIAKGAKGIPANALASTLAGATAFSPDHQNFGNALEGADSYLGGAISRAFATDPNDPEWKNRLRNALQEGGLALAGDKIMMPVLRTVGGAIQASGQKALDIAPVHEWFIEALGLQKQVHAMKVRQAKGVQPKQTARVLQIIDGKAEFVDDEAISSLLKAKIGELPNPTTTSERLTFQAPTGKTASQFIQTEEGLKAFTEQLDAAVGKEAKTLVLNDLTHQLLESQGAKKVAETTANWAKQGQELLNQSGIDVDVARLLREDTALNPTQLYAFAHLAKSTTNNLMTSITRVEELGLAAAGEVSDEMATQIQSNFVRNLVDHIDMQELIKGDRNLGTTLGKSLSAWKAIKKDNHVLGDVTQDILSSPELANLLKSTKFGGTEIGRLAAMLGKASLETGPRGVANTIKDGLKSGGMDMFIEAWINQGLLSNPATHIMNMVIGSANVASHIGSQWVAAGASKIPGMTHMLGTEDVTLREAWGSMYGVMAGLTKAFRLSFKAGITGESKWGTAKIDNYGMQHIAAKSLDMEGTAIGLGLDYMGSLTRSSGRFLLMEDEFVKTIASEMKKHSLAWKYAFANGRKADGAQELYKDIIDNPGTFKERMAGVDYPFEQQMKELADLVTFQKKNGMLADGLSKITYHLPVLKIGIPFIKVLANIPKWTIQHSPLGLVPGLKSEEFQRGGSAKMLEYGRMAYGSMMMLYGAQLYSRGDMTGSGHREYWKDTNSKETGVRPPKSLKVKSPYAKANQKYWVDVSRFAPYSNLLGMGADIEAIRQTHKDAPLSDIMHKAYSSLQTNLIDPTWAPSLHKVLGVIADSSSDPGTNTRAIKSIMGTMQPAFVRANETLRHPGKADLRPYKMETENIRERTTQDWSGFTAQLLATGVHSEAILTKNNVLGDEVKHERGETGSGIPAFLSDPVWSFLRIRKADETPALVHLFGDKDNLGVDFRPPPLEINVPGMNTGVKLKPSEWKEFTKRIGKQTAFNLKGMNLKQHWEYMYNSPAYQKRLKEWDKGKGSKIAEGEMASMMTNVYNSHTNAARGTMIRDFGLKARAKALNELFTQKDKQRSMRVEAEWTKQ
mgnify:CR=1 FL=1